MNDLEIISALSEIEDELIQGLKKIMSIESVKSTPLPDAPFGSGPKKALDETLKIAELLGFETKQISHAIGYAQLGNESTNYIGVIGHLDVVPAGDGWTYPPFDLTLDNGIFYGRGILDNKGPIIANLFALAALKRLNLPFNKTIRIIFGTDEESGSQDIPLYLASEEPPMYGYTPDCKYPAVYGERGIVTLTLKIPVKDGSLNQITSLHKNFVRGSVPDDVTVTLESGERISIKGKRAPTNAPELGINAITLLANKLSQVTFGECQEMFAWIDTSFHDKHFGEGVGINFSDEDSGKLALTPIDLDIDNHSISLTISIRYPIKVTEDMIKSELKKHIPKNATITIDKSMPSVLFDKHHPMIHTMTDVYETVTQSDGTPVTTTGATYARSMPNIIAFGPSFPGQKGIAHNKDEYMTKDDLMMNLKIYGLLLAKLGTN